MWSVEIVKARFFEAADVERRMFVKGMSAGGNAWPSYSYDADDMAGWDDQAIADNLERWQGRKVTKSPELTRWEEVFYQWTPLIPHRPLSTKIGNKRGEVSQRKLMWRYAECIASGKPFVAYCERKGINRSTAYNRRDAIFNDLALRFRNDNRLLLLPDERASGQQTHEMRPQAGPIGEPTAERGKPHPPFRTEPCRDLLKSPAAIAEFSKTLSDHNERLRKMRLRKALRGVPEEASAA